MEGSGRVCTGSAFTATPSSKGSCLHGFRSRAAPVFSGLVGSAREGMGGWEGAGGNYVIFLGRVICVPFLRMAKGRVCVSPVCSELAE